MTYAQPLVHQLFEAQAATAPDAVAVVHGAASVSYRQLDERAEALAWQVRARCADAVDEGPAGEPVVAVRMPRGPELITALLAAAKAGAAYLPLDPGLPADRTRYLLRSAGARLLLTDGRRVPDADVAAVAGDLPVLDVRAATDGSAGVGADSVVTGVGADSVVTGVGADSGVRDDPRRLAYLIHTSGSTGLPKPVAVEHRSLANHAQAVRALFGLSRADRVLQFTNPGFDVLGEEVYPTLAAGGTLVVLDDTALPPAALEDFLRTHQVTVANLPTPYWAQWCADLERTPRPLPPGLRLLVVGSDTTHTRTLAAWRRHSAVPVINAYGLTETTITATAAVYPDRAPLPPGSTLPIGTALDGVQAYVLDHEMAPCRPGETGELYIGGRAVARGYQGRADLTARRFVPDPFAGNPGDRLYRTGDLARRDADGAIEFLGRDDHQVKIRGHRVEPAEAEAALAQDLLVRECAVVAVTPESGHTQLVAYIVGDADPQRLRALAVQSLPDYAVPSAYVALPALPVTAQGKLDRKALPAPAPEERHSPYVRPEGPDEERLAALWSEVLGVRRVGRTDEFIGLGGDSLHMARVLGRMAQEYGTRVTAREFLAAGTVKELAVLVRGGTPVPSMARETAPADAVSPGEQRLWILGQFRQAAGTAYNVPSALRLRGPLDVAALRLALADVVERHERLRTSFHFRDGRLTAEIAQGVTVPLQVIDLSAGGQGAAAPLVRAEQLARQPFDLASAPLLRTALIRVAPDDHLLVVVTHHIVSDGVSSDVVDRDLAAAYAARLAGGTSPWQEHSTAYRDFIRTQADPDGSSAADALVKHVVERLRGAPTVLDLPADHPRPKAMSYRGHRLSRTTPNGLLTAVTRLAREEGTTPYCVVLTALGAALRELCGQDDLLIGSPAAGRPGPDFEDVVGFFVNTVVLRLDFRETRSFRDALRLAHGQVLDAIEHEYVPFDRLVQELVTERVLSVPPLVQAALAYQGPRRPEARLTGLRATPVPLHNGSAKFDLTLEIEEVAGEMVATVEYSTDLFARGTVEDLLDRWTAVISEAVARPDAALCDARGGART
ncbi:amino acid adenylation domain-containing protein [Streptomyces sp. NPDC046465]|uniref:amino acid adenylation domain-containing protein n=1 Tax=Streptomyces sp. NPDC046465 TaxID=3155810 RepID=UPI0033E13990